MLGIIIMSGIHIPIIQNYVELFVENYKCGWNYEKQQQASLVQITWGFVICKIWSVLKDSSKNIGGSISTQEPQSAAH